LAVGTTPQTTHYKKEQRVTSQDKFAHDLAAVLESIKQERMSLMNGSYPQDTRDLIYERLRYLANEAKSLLTEMDRIDEQSS
jgi:hypothetical protein